MRTKAKHSSGSQQACVRTLKINNYKISISDGSPNFPAERTVPGTRPILRFVVTPGFARCVVSVYDVLIDTAAHFYGTQVWRKKAAIVFQNVFDQKIIKQS